MVYNSWDKTHECRNVDGGVLLGRLKAVYFMNFVGSRAKSFIDGVDVLVVGVGIGMILWRRIHGKRKEKDTGEEKNKETGRQGETEGTENLEEKRIRIESKQD
jgi:hypothetical protein